MASDCVFAGLWILFLLAAAGIGSVSDLLRRYRRYLRYVSIVTGALLVFIGVLLLTDRMEFLHPALPGGRDADLDRSEHRGIVEDPDRWKGKFSVSAVDDAPAGGRRSGLLLILYAALGLAVGLGIGAFVFFQPQLFPASDNAIILQPTRQSAPAAVVGAPVPDFELQDLDGKAVKLSSYRGEAVLVNFWATWCGPCQAEMPLLQDRYTTYHDSGLEILAVNIGEDVDTVRPFIENLGLASRSCSTPTSKSTTRIVCWVT